MFKTLTHHAYCIEGEGLAGVPAFAEALRTAHGIVRGNPDLIIMTIASFGIDKARALARFAEERPLAGDKKFFIIGADALTHEAQNALLKIFEEPPLGTHFFVLLKTAEALLPTLRSRMERVRAAGAAPAASGGLAHDAAAFLALAPAARLARVAEIVDTLKKEKMTKGEAAAFVDALARAVRGAGAFPVARAAALRDALMAASYGSDRSASLKMLLEHLAVVLPRV